MTNFALRPNRLHLPQLILAITLLLLNFNLTNAEEPPADQPKEILINAIVGRNLDFHLDAPAEFSDIHFAELPEGLSYLAAEERITGIATTAGTLLTQVNFVEAGAASSMPVRFNVFNEAEFPGDPNNPNPKPDGDQPQDKPDQPIRIVGKQGSPLHFQLTYDLSVVPVNFATRPDGTSFTLPEGIDLVVVESSFTGTPTHHGVFDLELVFETANGPARQRFVFEIAQADQNPNPNPDPNNPNPNPDNDKPLHIRAVVGFELLFPLEIPEGISITSFSPIPAGLGYDADAQTVVGIPSSPGISQSTISYMEEGIAGQKQVVFEISNEAEFPGDPNNPNPKPDGDQPQDKPDEPIRIFGKQGSPLHFQLTYDLSVVPVNFATRPDGTSFALPEGIDLAVAESSFTGTPTHNGVFDLELVFETANGQARQRFVFEIAQNDQNPNPTPDPNNPNPNPNPDDDKPLHIRAVVGFELLFQLEIPEGISITSFSPIPAGLGYDADAQTVVGIPSSPGISQSTISYMEEGIAGQKQVVFEISNEAEFPGDPNNPNPKPDGNPDPNPPAATRIFGKAGDPLHFKLPLDLTDIEINFANRPDGSPQELPKGITLDRDQSAFTGVPAESGLFDLTLILGTEDGNQNIAFLFDFAPAGGPNPNPGPDTPSINIFGDVGKELTFALKLSEDLSNPTFDKLPEGLSFLVDSLTISGIPQFPGFHETKLHATRGDLAVTIPVYFDIFGDLVPPDGDGGHQQDIKIHGWVGDFVSFPLPIDPKNAQISLTRYADGKEAAFPVGLQLDAVNAFIVGFPQAPGFFDSSITVREGENVREIQVFFDIQYNSQNKPDVGEQPDHQQGLEENILFGEVGTRFAFKFPVKPDESVKLPLERDGIAFSLPTGLTYNAENLSITGAPTESGVFETLVIVEGPDYMRERFLRFLVSDAPDAPRLSFYSESEYLPGQAFSFRINTSGTATEYEVHGLPEGLSLDAASGIVSGTLDEQADYDLIVIASNAAGSAYGLHYLDSERSDNDAPQNPDGNPPAGDPAQPDDSADGDKEDPEPIIARLDVPFTLKAPSQFANATFALVDGESFPEGIEFDQTGVATIAGTPTEAGLFRTKITITQDETVDTFTLWFFVADSAAAPQFVAPDYQRVRPGEVFELHLPIANGPANIEIQSAPDGVNFDSDSKTIRGALSEPGFYRILVSATTDKGIGVHTVEIDVFDDGNGQNPGDGQHPPIEAYGIVGEPFNFPLPANPDNSSISFVDGEDGSQSEIPAGLQYVETYAIIRGIPEQEGVSSLFLEITEFGFTRREQIIFKIYTKDSQPDNPDFPKGPDYDEPDDGHVEPILAKVGERLYFEAPIAGDSVSFELVAGPDGEASELPPGISFDAQLGILSGVPTASGIYPIWVKVDQSGSVRTHFAPIIVSGVEGSPAIVSSDFFTTAPGEHFKFEIKASNDPTVVKVDFLDVPGVLSFDPASMILEGKFEFGGFFTLLVSATNDVGTGYGLINIDVLGINHDGGGQKPNDIPLNINGTVNKPLDFPLPAFIRGSSFVLATDPAGIESRLPDGLVLDAKNGRISGTPTQPGFTFVWVSVDDGALPSLAVNIGIAQGQRTPMIISPEFWVGHQDSQFLYQIHATDKPFEFFATGLPAGIILDSASGSLKGTPTESGDFDISLSAKNDAGIGQERALHLVIEEKPRLPIVSAPFYKEGQVGDAFSLQVNATENPGFYHAGGLPAGLNINSETGLISGTPVSAGFFDVNLEATNQWGRGSIRISIKIKRAALAPAYIGPANVGGKVGQNFSFRPPASGDVTGYSISPDSPIALPAGLILNPSTGEIAGIPTGKASGTVDLVISGPGGSTVAHLYFKIAPALDAPVINSQPFARGSSGKPLSYQILASNSPIEFGAQNLPAGLTIDTATGLISGTPETAGYYDIILAARNAAGWGQIRLLVLDIIPGLQAPTITSAPWAKGEATKPFSFQIAANNEPIAFQVAGSLPEGITLNESTGLLSGTPTKAGYAEVTISASNASGSGNGMIFIISIRPSQEMPVVTSSGTSFAKVGEPFLYQIRASANPTSFSAENLPDGLALNATTGFITGKPTKPTTEPIVLVVRATNAAGQSLPRAVLLEILPAAAAPVILTGGHAIGKVGTEFEFQVFATNDPTAYSSPNLPDGLSIASDTGIISGTPEKAGDFVVTLQASNEAGTGDPAKIILFIIPGAEMPRVTSAPYVVGKVGNEFAYQILTSTELVDSYQVEGELPRGLDFDPTTGLISGSPVDPIILSVYLSVTNSAGTSAPQPLTIKIEPSLEAPIITSSLRISGTVGEEFSYTIDATNMPEERPLPPSASFDAVGLPSGLAINSATGTISGFPGQAGTYIATLVATNEAAQGAPRFLSIKIKPAPTAPIVTSVARVGAQVGKSFDYQIVASNSPSSYDADHSISWLSANTQSGLLSGTPTKPGIFYAALIAINEAGESNPGPLEITVYPAADTPKLTSSRTATGKIGSPFEYQIEASNSPTSYNISGLPAGLILNPATGLISGTPTASGTFEIVVVGSNANGEGAKATLVLTISPRTVITIVVPGT